MSTWISLITLTGKLVKLVPIALDHEHGLIEATQDGSLWQLWFTSVPNPEQMHSFISTALELQLLDSALAFSIVELNTGRILGSTRYCNIDVKNRRLEIGYTWYRESVQRTGVNTECKLLLLQHAFEHLQCIAVEFRTNWHNHKSRTAIARLGAKQDGILRQHQLMPDGQYRDTVVFSILNSEWPAVKSQLLWTQHRYNEITP
ncbi:MAG: GNAT family N-acetyltransferase [Arenimonas sp.]|nr:GNAT family N-acetyltransferase [Arenimonas sp.]